MSGLDSALTGFSNLALRAKVRNDDGVDQLHHFVTVAILACFAAITGFVEFVSEPLNCWNSGTYLWKHYQEHVNQFCWTHTLYRYPDSGNHSVMPYAMTQEGRAENAAQKLEADRSDSVHFLHWATIFFILQALLFKVPNLLWTEVNSSQGSNLVKMVEMLQGVALTDPGERAHKLRQVALFLEKWLRIHRRPRWFLAPGVSPLVRKTMSFCMVSIGSNLDNHLSTLYLVVKAVYLLNTLLQFLLLSVFLQLNFWNYGVDTLRAYEAAEGVFGAQTSVFPLVVLCPFQTYDKGSPLGYWVQCILTINIFLEKLFLVEWFWLLVLLVLTIISFLLWCFRILQTQKSLTFVQRYLKLLPAYSEPLEVPASRSEQQFVTEYLCNDGIFILRILAVNTNEVVMAQLVEELWRRYLAFEDGVDAKVAEPGVSEATLRDQ